MTILPETSPNPKPIVIFMPPTSTAEAGPSGGAAGPTPSAVPVHETAPDAARPVQDEGPRVPDREHDTFALPKLRLELRDLAHAGTKKFLASVNASQVMDEAVHNVLRILYKSPSEIHTHPTPTRSVTVILRDMDGVAYTTGTELDDDHKEIHFSLRYIDQIRPASRLTAEITGVLTHELVHCYQWNAHGTCPGGLIEGIADFCRLNCDLSPPHWKQETKGKWDGGYQHTAYFLQYLENRFGDGTVRKLNEKLRLHKYHEKPFWTELLGRPVDQLWADYVEAVKDPDNSKGNSD